MVDGGSGGVDHASGNYVSGPHTRWPAQNPTLLPSWPVTETVYAAAEWLEAVRVSGKLAMGRMLCVPVYRLYVVRCRLIGVVKRRERNLHFPPFLTRTQSVLGELKQLWLEIGMLTYFAFSFLLLRVRPTRVDRRGPPLLPPPPPALPQSHA